MGTGINWVEGTMGIMLLSLGASFGENVSFEGRKYQLGFSAFTPPDVDANTGRGETTVKIISFSLDCQALP